MEKTCYMKALAAELAAIASKKTDYPFTGEDAEAAGIALLVSITDDGKRASAISAGSEFGNGMEYEDYVGVLNSLRKVTKVLEAAMKCGIIRADFMIGEHPDMDAIFAAEIRDKGWSPFYETRGKGNSSGWVDELAPPEDRIAAMFAALASLDA